MNTRNTIQKQFILNSVRELKNHPTSEEIYNYIKPNFPSISLGTVYRNLNILSENNEIQKISVIDEAIRFDHLPEDHYHFKCTKCKKLVDLDMEYDTSLDKKVAEKYNLNIIKHNIVFDGICEDCK